MKILQIGKYYHPALGGIETVVRAVSEGLVSRGHSVTVLCYSSDVQEVSEDLLQGVKVLRVPMKGTLFSQPISFSYRNTLLQHAADYDLLHFHIPNPLAEFSALSLPPRLPYVATFHAQIVRQKLLRPFYRPLVRRLLKGAKQIILPTRKHLTSSSFLEGFGPQCTVIPFGLNSAASRASQPLPENLENFSQRLQNKHGKFILFVGRLVEYKGLTYLLDAMKVLHSKVPDLKLVIVGEGPEEFHLKLKTSELGLESVVHFAGRVSNDEDLKAYYHACRFFVLPSISPAEAFGLVLLEAMAFGKALITTELDSGVSEVNLHDVTGLQVPPCDSTLLAGALIELASNPALCEKLGQGGKQRLATEFTHERMIDAHLEVYNLALSTAK